MATLHLETDVAKETQQTISRKYQAISSEVGAIADSVNNLRSNWQGNSANQFFQQFDQWKNITEKLLEELSQMSASLQSEINEWEITASKFE